MNFLFNFCQFEFLFQIVLILQVKHIMLAGGMLIILFCLKVKKHFSFSLSFFSCVFDFFLSKCTKI